MAGDPRAAQVEAALAQARGLISATAPERDPVALHLPHLERSMKTVQRYAALYSDTPFVSNVPLLGPLIILAKNLARRVLRAGLQAAFGSQAEFNAAVAEILFEFTRRAALSQNLPAAETTAAPDALARELAALRESVRAANLGAAEAEREVTQLRQELEKLKRANPP